MSLVCVSSCYKNPENSVCIDFFLQTKTFASRTPMLSKQDCLISMNVTVIKTYFRKMKPETIRYKSYRYKSSPLYEQNNK